MAGEQECGFCGFYPRWLRNKATSKSFIIVYGLLGTIQAMSFIYIIVTLNTLEKRFKIPSQTTGIILSGNEISQVLSLVLVYYGGSGHRPRWIATGVALSSVSCLVLALPHFIYGPGKDALALTKEHLNQTLLNTTSRTEEVFICTRKAGSESCDDDSLMDISLLPRLLIFMSQFILGVGTTLYYGLGQTYLDDNAKKTNTPMLLGFTFALRTVGPVLGFLLGYLCVSLYIDPTLHPVITQQDPRWLGAWWLGWIILGVIMAIFSVLVAMFPKELSKTKPVSTKDGEIPLKLDLVPDQRASPRQQVPTSQQVVPKQVPKIKDFPKALKRLITNRIIMCNNICTVLYVLGAAGFITFITKYLEVQYGTSAGGGTAVAGPISLLGMVLGFMVSGLVISKFKPGPRYLLGWNLLVGASLLIGMISYAFLGCPASGIHGLDMESMKLNLSATCNEVCTCEGIKYSPVCHEPTGTTFYSACHAGCMTILDDNKFGSCACVSTLNTLRVENYSEFDQPSTISSIPSSKIYSSELVGSEKSSLTIDDTVKSGPCATNCRKPYLWFVIMTSCIQLLACSGKIGNILVNYRAVNPEDKSIAQGFSLMLISLFGLIPGPIIYGALIDSACVIWEESCGQKGNCWYYDKDRYRHLVNFAGAGFVAVGLCFEVAVWYLAKGLDLYGSSDEDMRREFVKVHPVAPNEMNNSTAINGIVNSTLEVEQTRESDAK